MLSLLFFLKMLHEEVVEEYQKIKQVTCNTTFVGGSNHRDWLRAIFKPKT